MVHITKKTKEKVRKKFDGHCAYCGCILTDENFTVDHIYPSSRGGSDAIDNLHPACKECNNGKGNATIKEIHKMFPDEKFYFEVGKKKRTDAKQFSQVLKEPKAKKKSTKSASAILTDIVEKADAFCKETLDKRLIESSFYEKGYADGFNEGFAKAVAFVLKETKDI